MDLFPSYCKRIRVQMFDEDAGVGADDALATKIISLIDISHHYYLNNLEDVAAAIHSNGMGAHSLLFCSSIKYDIFFQ